MIRIPILLASLILASSVYAKNTIKTPAIQAKTFADGIEFQLSDRNTDLQLTVAGPANSRFTQRYSGDATVFLDVNSSQGTPMADGFYKYEAWPIPAVTISREESMKMPDRNSLVHLNTPQVSPLSGTFRIVNGMLLDTELKEFDQHNAGESQK